METGTTGVAETEVADTTAPLTGTVAELLSETPLSDTDEVEVSADATAIADVPDTGITGNVGMFVGGSMDASVDPTSGTVSAQADACVSINGGDCSSSAAPSSSDSSSTSLLESTIASGTTTVQDTTNTIPETEEVASDASTQTSTGAQGVSDTTAETSSTAVSGVGTGANSISTEGAADITSSGAVGTLIGSSNELTTSAGAETDLHVPSSTDLGTTTVSTSTSTDVTGTVSPNEAEQVVSGNGGIFVGGSMTTPAGTVSAEACVSVNAEGCSSSAPTTSPTSSSSGAATQELEESPASSDETTVAEHTSTQASTSTPNGADSSSETVVVTQDAGAATSGTDSTTVSNSGNTVVTTSPAMTTSPHTVAHSTASAQAGAAASTGGTTNGAASSTATTSTSATTTVSAGSGVTSELPHEPSFFQKIVALLFGGGHPSHDSADATPSSETTLNGQTQAAGSANNITGGAATEISTSQPAAGNATIGSNDRGPSGSEHGGISPAAPGGSIGINKPASAGVGISGYRERSTTGTSGTPATPSAAPDQQQPSHPQQAPPTSDSSIHGEGGCGDEQDTPSRGTTSQGTSHSRCRDAGQSSSHR
jgi:hypothetical protein